MRSKNLPVSDCTLTPYFKKKEQIVSFKALEEWLTLFKSRHNSKFKVINCKTANKPVYQHCEEIGKKKIRLPDIMKDFDIADIFNEIGLFFTALRNKASEERIEKWEYGKILKERLSIIFCISFIGEKLKSLVTEIN